MTVHELPELGYDYNSLEPYIDEETMKFHHDKHHQAYLKKFLSAIENNKELLEKPIEEILSNLDSIPEQIKQAVINNGGGFYNHKFFWTILKKDFPFNPESEIGKAVNEAFGSFESFKEQFSKASATVFGSGWAWLVSNNGKLEIAQTKNQDSPISNGKTPLIAIDVWEHAYYLKYKNKRPEYIEAFFNIINWEKVNEYFTSSKK